MGILYGEFCSVVDVLRRKRLLLAGRVACNLVFLLSLKHNYSITARGPVDDQVYLKELLLVVCYLYGRGIFRNTIMIPRLHWGQHRLSIPVMKRYTSASVNPTKRARSFFFPISARHCSLRVLVLTAAMTP